MTTSKVSAIQALRFFAAIEVVAWHSDTVTKHLSDIRVEQSSLYQPVGGIGVEIFFVISGFIISLLCEKRETATGFLTKRIIRILPMYWLFTGLVLLAFQLNKNWHFGSAEHNLPFILKSLFALPLPTYPILGVGWTLEHEFLFYTLCAAIIPFGTSNTKRCAILLSCLALYGVGLARDWKYDYHLFSSYWIYFAIGIYTEMWSNKRFSSKTAVAILLPILVAATAHPEPVRITLSLILFFSIFACASKLHWKSVFQPIATMGEWSFSLYLSHGMVLSVLGKILATTATHIGIEKISAPVDLFLRVAAALIALAVAFIIYRTIETPATTKLKSALQQDRTSL